MTKRADFNAEEWATVVQAPALVIVDRHADTAEREAYRGFVMKVARTVAGAHKEGGFLGIGGTDISQREQAVLDRIAASLRTDRGGV